MKLNFMEILKDNSFPFFRSHMVSNEEDYKVSNKASIAISK